jgi:hypothetical protein
LFQKLGKYDTITADYKYPEGTDENEKAWERAFSFVGLTDKKNRSKMQKSLIGRKNSDVNISKCETTMWLSTFLFKLLVIISKMMP